MKFAIKLNNNHYYPIDKSYIDLAILNDDFTTLEGIDNFTSIYTKQELVESFERSNVLSEESFEKIRNEIYLEDSNVDFVIIYEENNKLRELKAFTRDDGIFEFDVLEYLINNIDNKNMTNQIRDFFTSKNYISEEVKTFAYLLYNQEIDLIQTFFVNLDYFDQRLIKMYVYKTILPKDKTLKLSLYN